MSKSILTIKYSNRDFILLKKPCPLPSGLSLSDKKSLQ